MDIYLVGGAVRDELLGLPVKERDWVVVGATPQQMIDLGYKPVGGFFPVFLHPDTGEEYAIARTERKTGHGYGGFTFHTSSEVSLEEDLLRRDLSINAMAKNPETGEIIDPYNGRQDLKARILRHVSPAFREDPLRVLRVARFAARYRWMGFRVAEDTLEEMMQISLSDELRHLKMERVWKETSRAMMERSPQVYFQTLHDAGALGELFPELADLDGLPQCPGHQASLDVLQHQWRCQAQAARMRLPLTARYALLCHDIGKAMTPPDGWPDHRGHQQRSEKLCREMSERLKVPKEMADAAAIMARWQSRTLKVMEARPPEIWELLRNLDVLRRPRRLKFLLDACEADARVCAANPKLPFPQREFLLGLAEEIRHVDVAGLRQAGLTGPALGRALDDKRVRAIKEYKREFMEKWHNRSS